LPNFWKIDGKPVIVTWSTHAYQSAHGNAVDAFKRIGSRSDVFLFGEVVGTGTPDFEWYKAVDGIYTYQPLLSFVDSVWPYAGGKLGTYKAEDILNEALTNMGKWESFIEKYGISLSPTVSPGNDKTYDYRDNNRPSIILRSPYSFQKFMEAVLNRKPKVIFVCSFNEWFEGTSVEPSREIWTRIFKNSKGSAGRQVEAVSGTKFYFYIYRLPLFIGVP